MLRRFKNSGLETIIDLEQIETIQQATEGRTFLVFRSGNTEYLSIPFEEMVDIWHDHVVWYQRYQRANDPIPLRPVDIERP